MTRLIQHIAKRLETALGLDYATAEQEAWWILETITGLSKARLLFLNTQTLTQDQELTLEKMLKQRIEEKKPLQYILGSVPFCNLEILVRPPILIPRPETEEWVSWLINLFDPIKQEPLKILDLCTGTGCIALALAHAFSQSSVIGIDINPEAINLANDNKSHNAIKNVTFLYSDLYAALNALQPFHLIVSNPPYITEKEYASLDPSVTTWEDRQALVAEHEGMAIYERIIQNAHTYLTPHPLMQIHNLPTIVLESGTDPQAIESLLLSENFSVSHTFSDMQHKIRCICARQKGLI
jgi:release factor glutamine methyltransferase